MESSKAMELYFELFPEEQDDGEFGTPEFETPEEEAKKEAEGIQEISQKVTEATDILRQGIEGLTAAVKEIAPQKSKLRDKLKGMIDHGDK